MSAPHTLLESTVGSTWTIVKGRWDRDLMDWVNVTEEASKKEIPARLVFRESDETYLVSFDGPTGYEIYDIEALLGVCKGSRDFCVCAGTINSWPRCDVDLEDLRRFKERVIPAIWAHMASRIRKVTKMVDYVDPIYGYVARIPEGLEVVPGNVPENIDSETCRTWRVKEPWEEISLEAEQWFNDFGFWLCDDEVMDIQVIGEEASNAFL
jgi:hypothetical protein